MFGAPGEGVHEKRIFGVAFIDTFLTFVGSVALAYYFNPEISICSVFCWFIILIILGAVMHWIFCVDTALNVGVTRLFTTNEGFHGWH